MQPSVSTPAIGGLTTLDHVVIAMYLASMLTMGIYLARRQHSIDDFFVGGRNLPGWAVGISILASLFSTITYLGMPGEMFRTGVGFLTRQLGIPFVLCVVWFLWIPFFMKMKLTSAYEYLERRFGYATRAFGAGFCLMLLFGWVAVVVLTASGAMVEITQLKIGAQLGLSGEASEDADLYAIILSVGLFSVLYTTLGGIRAVVWTDVVQFIVLISGAIFAIAFVAIETGSGVGDWLAAQQTYAYRENVEWYSLELGNRSTVLFISVGMFFWYVCTHGANQIALQRYFTVASVREARKSYLVSAVANFFLGSILAAVGLALVYYSQHYPLPASENLLSPETATRVRAQDALFPQFISFCLPSGLRGLVVSALFAAAMSTIDSGANSASTIMTVDFVRPLTKRPLSAETELRLARAFTAGMGILVVLLTISLYHLSKGTDIISLCQKGFNCFLGALGGLFVAGMFLPRVNQTAMLPALLIGELTGILTSYSQELFGVPFSTHLVVPTSWLITLVSAQLLAVVFQTSTTPEQRRWLWGSVVRSDALP